MSTDKKTSLISLVQDVLKRHNCLFDVINENTIHLDSFDSMSPIFEITGSRVALTCPVAYYETEEQCNAILKICEENRQLLDDSSFGPFSDENDNPLRQYLPEDARFENLCEQRLINVSSVFSRDSIIESPETFYSVVSSMPRYPKALYGKISPAIYGRMPKTIVKSTEARAFFYSSMLLQYRGEEASSWRMVDYNDIRTAIRHSDFLYFYPSLTYDSYEGLVKEIEKSFRKDISTNEPFQMVVSLTLPQKFFSESFKSQNPYTLREKFRATHILFNIYKADDGHPFTAETILLEMNK